MTAPEPPPYNPQIPLADDTIADGQAAFLTNFSTIFSAFGINHVDLDDVTNPGNHNVVQLIEQPKGRATQSQEIVVYSKKVPNQTDQIFMRYPLDGKEFQLTQYQIYSLETTATQVSYFTTLPGGIIVYFGRVNPTYDGFPINLNPAICRNIMGINLCVIGPQPPPSLISDKLYQSNVKLVAINGVFTQVVLDNSVFFEIPPNQYYLIFGNIGII